METKYSYQDVALVPSVISEIEHRSECILPFPLPIFTAPMTTVVSGNCMEEYRKNDIIPILPRPESIADRLENKEGWSAFSLSEFEEHYLNAPSLPACSKALIDIANGHMALLYRLIFQAKQRYGAALTVMIGNIANPKTYALCDAAGADYVRVGIGAGKGCITSSNTAIHYPMASLVKETAEEKKALNGRCRIVADGGIRDYADVVKALALGADAVMIGSVFSGLEGTPGEVTTDGYKKFYGMASREGQIDMKGEKTHTAEGTVKLVKVTGTIPGWVCNMKDYLRSAMSYCGARTLSEFKPEIVILSEGTKQTINR